MPATAWTVAPRRASNGSSRPSPSARSGPGSRSIRIAGRTLPTPCESAPLITTTSTASSIDAGSRNGPAGSKAPLPKPRAPSITRDGQIPAQRQVLQAVVRQHQRAASLRQQLRGGDAIHAHRHGNRDATRDQCSLIAHDFRLVAGNDQAWRFSRNRHSLATPRQVAARPRAAVRPARSPVVSCPCPPTVRLPTTMTGMPGMRTLEQAQRKGAATTPQHQPVQRSQGSQQQRRRTAVPALLQPAAQARELRHRTAVDAAGCRHHRLPATARAVRSR